MLETPLYMNQVCYGVDLRQYDIEKLRSTKKINLQWMMELYKAYPLKEKFFDYTQSKQIGNIDKLSGTAQLKEQIIAGLSEEEIRKSWEPGLSNYKKMRQKYLLYLWELFSSNLLQLICICFVVPEALLLQDITTSEWNIIN